MRAFSCITASILVASAAFAQVPDTPVPHFEAADVHVSPPSNNQFGRGPTVNGARYDIHHMTLVEIIVRAYDVTADKVLEGPNWLEYDRFDISAVMPPKSSAADRKLMLQALLADRFQLVVHPDQRPMLSYALTAPKGKQKMKEADGSGETGCKSMLSPPPPPPPPGQPFVPPTLSLSYTCRNMTMAAFAEGMTRMTLAQQFIGTNPVQDKTGLEGKWDFNFKYTLPMAIFAPGEGNPLPEALEKQVGLKLEEVTTTRPVIVVEKANRTPTPNEPGIAQKIPVLPTEFEVATIKPFEQAPGVPRIMMRMMPGGRFESSGIPVKMLLQQAWAVQTDAIIGAPKWMDTDAYNIVAKIPSQEGNTPPDTDLVSVMLRALLADRFKLAAHMEERPMTAYNLTAPKPKLKKADPASRTKWTDGNGPIFFSGSSIPSRTIKFQNMSMAQLAETLQSFAATYIHSPVKDATGLEGGYDFTLTFSLISSTQLATMSARGPVSPPAGGGGDVVTAADPVSSTSIFEAVEKQLGLKLVEEKRPVSVLVIDHIEQKPTEN